jgi:hypothetical protein
LKQESSWWQKIAESPASYLGIHHEERKQALVAVPVNTGLDNQIDHDAVKDAETCVSDWCHRFACSSPNKIEPSRRVPALLQQRIHALLQALRLLRHVLAGNFLRRLLPIRKKKV